MVTKHSEVCDSDEIVPYSQKFDVENAEVHRGVFWCEGCERQITTTREDEKEVFVL